MENVNCTNCGAENVSSNKYCSKCGFALPINQTQTEEQAQPPADTLTAKINRKKGLFGAVLGITLFTMLFFFIKSLMFNSNVIDNFKGKAVENVLVTFVDEFNKSCPIEVDEITRLDFVEALPGRILKYNYTLAVNKSEVNLEEFRSQMEPNVISTVQQSTELQIFRNYKTTFVQSYNDINGEHIIEVTVTPDMY